MPRVADTSKTGCSRLHRCEDGRRGPAYRAHSRRQTKARPLDDDDDDDPTWRPPHAESVCAQRRKALCIVPVSPQDWRVVKFGHQEVQNVTVGVLQREQFSVSVRRRSG